MRLLFTVCIFCVQKNHLAVCRYFSAITAAFLILGKTLYEPFAEFVGYDVEEEYLLDTYSYTLVICLLTVSAFVLYRFIKKNTDEEKFKALYNAALFTTAFTLLTLRNQSFMRVQQYYALFFMLLVPELVRAFNNGGSP